MPIPRFRRSSFASYSWVAALGLGCLLVSSSAWARPVVAVADFTNAKGLNSGAKARAAIIRALQEKDEVALLPFSRVRDAAAGLHIRARDLAQTDKLCQAVSDAGADSVITGSVFRVKGKTRLSVSLHDRFAQEQWSKNVALGSSGLSPQLARTLAAALAAAAGAQVTVAPPPPPPPLAAAVPPPPTPPAPALASDPEPRRIEASALDESERYGMDLSEPRRSLRESSSEEDLPARFASQPRLGDGGPTLFQFNAAVTATWRSFDFCPEVESCDQTPPANAGDSVRYTTAKPFGGFRVGLDLFPMHRRPDALRGLGFSAEYARSLFLVTNYSEGGATKEFGSTQQRISLEAVYRYYFRLGDAGTAWLGGRVGWLSHQFLVDENPLIVESRRSGLFGALDLGLPLHRFLRFEARGALVPWASPGEAEKQVYGVAASGGGFNGSAGFATDFGHPEWGIGATAMVDYAFFGDRYSNGSSPSPTRPYFGRSTEDYVSVSMGVRARY